MKLKIETVLIKRSEYMPSPISHYKHYTEEAYWVYRETTNSGSVAWEKLAEWDCLCDAQKHVKGYKKTFEVEEFVF